MEKKDCFRLGPRKVKQPSREVAVHPRGMGDVQVTNRKERAGQLSHNQLRAGNKMKKNRTLIVLNLNRVVLEEDQVEWLSPL